nr:hypothetical protein [Methylomarinum sp. Ch1-1]MDP4523310.1 hypothetical protein [Methylomarinum sp. Ch1-1]
MTDSIDISQLILDIWTQYIESGLARSFYQINNGLCDDFSLDVIAAAGGSTENFFDVQAGNFMEDNNFDRQLLENHWRITPPKK